MSENVASIDQRRAQRQRANFTAVVTDVISGQPIGHHGNLSSNGMLMISSHAPRSEAIYQVSLSLPGLPAQGRYGRAIASWRSTKWTPRSWTPGWNSLGSPEPHGRGAPIRADWQRTPRRAIM